jgi:hypothetical protein
MLDNHCTGCNQFLCGGAGIEEMSRRMSGEPSCPNCGQIISDSDGNIKNEIIRLRGVASGLLIAAHITYANPDKQLIERAQKYIERADLLMESSWNDFR